MKNCIALDSITWIEKKSRILTKLNPNYKMVFFRNHPKYILYIIITTSCLTPDISHLLGGLYYLTLLMHLDKD